MLHPVRVARDVAHEVLLEEPLRGLLLAPETPARDEIGRGAQLAALPHEPARHLDVLLHRPVALRVRDDHGVAHALELEDGALVLLELELAGARGELEQKLVAPVERQAARPRQAEVHELRMVHLEAHGEREAVRVRAQQLEGVPHGVVVEVRVAAMRRAHDARHARGLRGLEHAQALVQIARAVVHTGQDMAMHVPPRLHLLLAKQVGAAPPPR